jgi:hypothetical protein
MSPFGKKGRALLSATSRLTAAGRARRRFNCAKQGEWDERAMTAAGLLYDNRTFWEGTTGRPLSIADFGAGNERMRSLLKASLNVEHTYHPFDLFPQRSTTTRLDVAAGLPDEAFDIAICLGLLEYLPSIRPLAESLHRHCKFSLVSYVTSDSPVSISRSEREHHHWTTHATEAELKADFEGVGFTPVASARSDGEATTIWLWARAGQ